MPAQSQSASIHSPVRPFWRRDKVRAYPRAACCIPAAARYEGTFHDNEGLVLALSRGGLLFREASRFVMDRTGAQVVIRVPGLSLPGCILRSEPRGYAVRLNDVLDEARWAALVDDYGLAERPGPMRTSHIDPVSEGVHK